MTSWACFTTCTRKIKGTLKTTKCPEDCKVCEKEIDRKEYNAIRWSTSSDGYCVCGSCYDKLGSEPICVSCFCKYCYTSFNEGCSCTKD